MTAQVQIIVEGFMIGCTKVAPGRIITVPDHKAIELIKSGMAVYPGEYKRRDMQAEPTRRRRKRVRVETPVEDGSAST